MQPKNLPVPGNSEKHGEDRATAAILASGGAGGVSAFALRHWCPDGNPTEPVFITWLLGIGRFCLTVKYGRYSLKGADWYLDSGSGPRATPSPLDQARFEALQLTGALQRRLNRRAPVSPGLAFFDMERNRRLERLARRSGVPLLWDLEGYTVRLADAPTDVGLRQSLERSQVLEEISSLVEYSPPVGVRSFRAGGRHSQSTSPSWY